MTFKDYVKEMATYAIDNGHEFELMTNHNDLFRTARLRPQPARKGANWPLEVEIGDDTLNPDKPWKVFNRTLNVKTEFVDLAEAAAWATSVVGGMTSATSKIVIPNPSGSNNDGDVSNSEAIVTTTTTTTTTNELNLAVINAIKNTRNTVTDTLIDMLMPTLDPSADSQ